MSDIWDFQVHVITPDGRRFACFTNAPAGYVDGSLVDNRLGMAAEAVRENLRAAGYFDG